ncbi:hypothetical protein EVB79_036 [Rhizobium phage RHph_N3_13]|nr:hypothetical protein EVB79_036 [Rhizobium phage RHph_N3_13]QIG69863.1 hypothetical protein F67_I3_11_037 [Rhizobium phage RHph_I3_11]
MKIYKVMKFRANGWNEWHDCMGTFSTREKAERKFKELGLKNDPKYGNLWSDYIQEQEID